MHVMDSLRVPSLLAHYKYIIYINLFARFKHYYSITALALHEVSSCLNLIAQYDCD